MVTDIIAKVAVVLNARNEEKVLSKTISAILSQELLPYRIIVINDGSTDRTGEVAANFPKVEVINKEKRNESYLARKELAGVINEGLRKLHSDKNCEFVCMMGADLLLPKNYLSTIISRMKKDPKIAISSGKLEGEFSIEPRGGGRIVRCDFWRELGFLYPENYGWEGYLVLKAQSMGYEVRSYSDIVFQTQRKTGTKFDSSRYFYYGLALKALGYTGSYTFGKALLFFLKHPSGSYHMVRGFLSDYDDLYEPELREYVRKSQKNVLKSNVIKRFFNVLRHSK